MSVLAIVPARSGSKGIVGKNIRPFAGKPLMVWSIEHALACTAIDRVVVSTDSDAYAMIAAKAGAGVVPRSPFAARDTATDDECMHDVLARITWKPSSPIEYLIYLRPTCPVREPGVIEQCLDAIDGYDEVLTMSPISEAPWKSFVVRGGRAVALADRSIAGMSEPSRSPRQLLPQCYLHNGCVDVYRVEALGIVPRRRLTKAVLQPSSWDIDDEEQWARAEAEMVMRTTRRDTEHSAPLNAIHH